ncbi:hypothetical protein WDW86_20960 [Bdellovibrionota bacterium FG-2]
MQLEEKDRDEYRRYTQFMDFIRVDIQRERKLVHRKLFGAFLWCFLLPAGLSILVILLGKTGWMPRAKRISLDWFVLVFPVAYSLYVLGSDVIRELPAAFKQGGVATSLGQAIREAEWRKTVCAEFRRKLQFSSQEWRWVIQSFEIDLDNMRSRTKYLTALGGAVFFLLLQGVDWLTEAEGKVSWIKSPVGWVETAGNDLPQLIALVFFLVLLYLSGNQTYRALLRYLNAAKLMILS